MRKPSRNPFKNPFRNTFRKASRIATWTASRIAFRMPPGLPLVSPRGMLPGMPLGSPLGRRLGTAPYLRNPFLIIPLEICARNLFTDPSRNSERYPSKIPFRSPFRKEKPLGMYFRNAPRNSSRMFLAISLVMRLGVPPGML